ncbi:MAG: hypothetical protein ACE5L6_04305 [Candidatus Bathyarchaeia archaeon]
MVPRLLGRYKNFPEVIHGVARFTFGSSTKKMQNTILRVLHELNKQVLNLRSIATLSSSTCQVGFELGIADGVEFNYLDEHELNRLQGSVVKRAMSTVDLFCVVRYHVTRDGKLVPLRFDYYMLRFTFHSKNSLELRISHQRGIQRLSVENLITFITKRINEELSKDRLRPLELKSLKAL